MDVSLLFFFLHFHLPFILQFLVKFCQFYGLLLEWSFQSWQEPTLINKQMHSLLSLPINEAGKGSYEVNSHLLQCVALQCTTQM